jgi:hypothetical protein
MTTLIFCGVGRVAPLFFCFFFVSLLPAAAKEKKWWCGVLNKVNPLRDQRKEEVQKFLFRAVYPMGCIGIGSECIAYPYLTRVGEENEVGERARPRGRCIMSMRALKIGRNIRKMHSPLFS